MSTPGYMRPVHDVTGLPSPPSWAGYWYFVVGVIFVSFVLVLAKKGTLSTWLGFLSWGTPRVVSIMGSSSDAGAPIVGTTPGTPGITLDPLAGLPKSWGDFIFGGTPFAPGGK